MDSSGLPSLLIKAAQSAAVADGVVLKSDDGKKKTEVDGGAAEAAAAATATSAAVNNDSVKLKNEGQGVGEEKDEASNNITDDAPNNAKETPAAASADPQEVPVLPPLGDSSVNNQIHSDVNGAGSNQAASSIGGADNVMATAASVDPSSAMAAQAQEAQSQQQVAQPTPPAPAPAPAPSEPKKRSPLRRGKWTPEEEAYASRLIQEFKAGLLPLTDGTTLRTFLSKLLNCDPMRISKKFVGSNCIGKQVFRRRGADVNNLTPDEIEKTRFELSELEKKFLDRVAQNKSSKGGGGGSSKSSKLASGMSSSGGGGLGMNNMNKSAAAVGRALLQGNKGPQSQAPQGNAVMDGGDSAAGGLLAQLQAQQPGMFDSNTARSFLNASGQQAGGHGNMNKNNSITNLMLQTGMSRDQISQFAQKGISSSASLANMLGKQRSFDQLMSLDFQSMQSIDNLANLIQAGMPNQVSGLGGRIPKAQMKNMDWGTQGGATGMGNGAPAGLLPSSGVQGSLENLVRTLSNNSAGAAPNNLNNQANATNFNNFLQLQNATQQGVNNPLAGAAGQAGGSSTNDISNILQSLTQQQNQQQQMNNNLSYSSLLQGMAAGGMGSTASMLPNNMSQGLNQNAGGSNDFMNMLNQSAAASVGQNNVNPLMQQLTNDSFGGGLQNASSQNNPMMAALAQQQLAQQQLLAQAGGGNNMANLLGQQNGLAGGMNNSLGSFGAALGGNFGGNLGASMGGSNFGAGQQNPAALLQQLLAQQSGGGGANNNQFLALGAQGTGQVAGNNSASGIKRSIDDANGGGGGGEDGGPAKKQQTVAL
mmetsp:Transcript_2603/g.5594  ORF Transcript_2603/g.5594 Transcript_2603/m.5594 type:complete len:817 (+) Transcript_2603:172-2622(+)